MSKTKLQLKDPVVAAMLAWLIPGFGHLYQGRTFKGILYAVCILGLFGWGMYLGDGKVVNWSWNAERKTFGYMAQVLVGLPALPALVQSSRLPPYSRELDRNRNGHWDRSENWFASEISAPFEGILRNARLAQGSTVSFAVSGKILVEPSPRKGFSDLSGTFEGELINLDEEMTGFPNGTKLKLKLTYLIETEPAIYPSPNRELACDVVGKLENGPAIDGGELIGEILHARGITDRYTAPLDDEGLQLANLKLGKYYEVGLIYTWIAGLLNILAMWDAFEGPAYGDGEDEDEDKPKDDEAPGGDKAHPAEATTPPSATDKPPAPQK